MSNLADVFDGGFDAERVPADERSFDLIPPGTYTVQIVESDVTHKDEERSMLKLTFEIVAGPYENRKLWSNLNIRHPSAEAQRIAQRELADLCLAVGQPRVTNSDELHFTPMLANVKVEKRKDTGDEQNKIGKFRPLGGAAPAAQPAPAAAKPAARPAQKQAAKPAAAPAGRPWGQRKAS